MIPMHEPMRGGEREPEARERLLYLLMLIAAVSVILFSLLGIASMLGYAPLAGDAHGESTGRTSSALATAPGSAGSRSGFEVPGLVCPGQPSASLHASRLLHPGFGGGIQERNRLRLRQEG